jgi:hypothetical protein
VYMSMHESCTDIVACVPLTLCTDCLCQLGSTGFFVGLICTFIWPSFKGGGERESSISTLLLIKGA